MLGRLLGFNFGQKWENRLKNWAWLILRVSVALLILRHGYSKLMGFSRISVNFYDPLGIGSEMSLALVVGSEFFGALLLLIGAFTRWSSVSLLFTMFIAAFIVHGHHSFAKKELAVLYAVVFLVFAVAGGGRYSVDHYLKKKLK